jgi:hypothetical protein
MEDKEYYIDKKSTFQIFGSATSLDCDVMVFVDEIPIKEHIATCLCKEYDKFLQLQYPEYFQGKEMNSNLAILEDGIISEVFKGTEDECNNSLFYTYMNFKQPFQKQILSLIDRDSELKLLRGLRIILSFLSRTKFRTDVKKALKGDAYEKIKVLKSIDLTLLKLEDLGKRRVTWEDYLKTLAFQLAQVLALLEEKGKVELYTKEDIIVQYPRLKPHIERSITADVETIEFYKNELIKKCDGHTFKQVLEYKFKK